MPPSVLTYGNVTDAQWAATNSCFRDQDLRVFPVTEHRHRENGTPDRMWTNTGNTFPDTHKNLAKKHGCSQGPAEPLFASPMRLESVAFGHIHNLGAPNR